MDPANVSLRASDAVASARAAGYVSDALSDNATRLSTAAELRLQAEDPDDGRLCETRVRPKNRFTMQPLHGTHDDSLYRVVGTERTNKGWEPRFRRTPNKKQHTGPTPRRSAYKPPTRPRAPPHRVPKGACGRSGATKPTASGRGLTRDYAQARLPRTSATLAVHSVYLHDRARAAPRRAAPPKKWPSPRPTCCPTPVVTWPARRS